MTAAIIRVCNLLGRKTCQTEKVVKNVVKNCYIGNCNSLAVTVNERRDTKCRPTGVLGDCETKIKRENYDLESCLWDLETLNSRANDLTCCARNVSYGVWCYDRPSFEAVTRSEFVEILQTDPVMLEEMNRLSGRMKCRLETDTKPNMDPYKYFMDEEFITALDNFLDMTPGATERSLIEELQIEFVNIPADFLTKVRQPAGLHMGDSYRTPVLNWLLAETAKRNLFNKNMAV